MWCLTYDKMCDISNSVFYHVEVLEFGCGSMHVSNSLDCLQCNVPVNLEGRVW